MIVYKNDNYIYWHSFNLYYNNHNRIAIYMTLFEMTYGPYQIDYLIDHKIVGPSVPIR
jgi:hypothetical protein